MPHKASYKAGEYSTKAQALKKKRSFINPSCCRIRKTKKGYAVYVYTGKETRRAVEGR